MLNQACHFLFSPLRRAKNWFVNLSSTPIVVLVYHRVTRLPSDPQLLSVTPENFRAQMRYLKDNFPVLRLDSDWSGVSTPSVVITFDDGYADNVHEALPILEEIGLPATFFIATGYIGSNREFWWDDLERVILTSDHVPESFRLDTDGEIRAWATSSAAGRERLYRDFHSLIKCLPHEQREQQLNYLYLWANVGEAGRASHRIVTLSELKQLAQSELITVGGHTVSHPALSNLPHDQQYKEISDSLRQLETLLGQRITVFSYPFGSSNDFTAETAEICHQLGLYRAVANIAGQCHPWTDPYQVPRNLVRNWELPIFKRKLKGFWVS